MFYHHTRIIPPDGDCKNIFNFMTTEPIIIPSLTPRQFQVAFGICRNKTTKEIAFELNLSPKTVEKYRAEAFRELNCHSIAGVIKRCLQFNIITLEEFLKD